MKQLERVLLYIHSRWLPHAAYYRGRTLKEYY